MQRTAGQHDNLTGLPLTHTCESRHRWSIVSRDRHYSPPRRAGRMVTPTRYARSGILGGIPICWPSLKSQERLAGRQRQKAQNCLQATLRICRDCTSPLSTPQIRQGSARSWRGQRLWALRELRGDERTQTTCLARSPIRTGLCKAIMSAVRPTKDIRRMG